MQKKRLYIYLLVGIIIFTGILSIRYRSQSLEKIVPEVLWKETTQCHVIEVDKFDMKEIDLNLGETFQNVKVRGPFREKNTAVNCTWIDIHPKIINTYNRFEIEVIREDIRGFVYTLNIEDKCYKVTAGKEEIDLFIDQMHELAEKDNATN